MAVIGGIADEQLMKITVFAYGSNMLVARMKARAASAQPMGVAFLERFVLRWNKRSQDGSGKCSIEETGRPEDVVWGVLYELSSLDKKELDRFEGLGKGYGERHIHVSSSGRNRTVLVYYATSVDPHIRPYKWYQELVIAGAREHGLPAEYIRNLEGIPAVDDPDKNRTALARDAMGVQKDAGN